METKISLAIFNTPKDPQYSIAIPFSNKITQRLLAKGLIPGLRQKMNG